MRVLFAWDARDEASEEVARQILQDGTADPGIRETAGRLAWGAWEQLSVIDDLLNRHAPQWPVRRQPGVDRALLRVAAWELVGTRTPPKVVIDQAVELAKSYGTEHSPAFVNGVLDAIMRYQQALTGLENP
jgi:N utilization substance protein B